MTETTFRAFAATAWLSLALLWIPSAGRPLVDGCRECETSLRVVQSQEADHGGLGELGGFPDVALDRP